MAVREARETEVSSDSGVAVRVACEDTAGVGLPAVKVSVGEGSRVVASQRSAIRSRVAAMIRSTWGTNCEAMQVSDLDLYTFLYCNSSTRYRAEWAAFAKRFTSAREKMLCHRCSIEYLSEQLKKKRVLLRLGRGSASILCSKLDGPFSTVPLSSASGGCMR